MRDVPVVGKRPGLAEVIPQSRPAVSRAATLVVLPRLLAAALFVVLAAGSWDIWWHAAVGRDSFWEPPHILLQAAIAVIIAGAAYGWWHARTRSWQWIALAALLVPLSAPFDELWHRAYGVETLISPLIVWSPPHVALVVGLLAVGALLLPLLRQEPDPVATTLFIALVAASLLELLVFLTIPLQPLGPYRLIGFVGAGSPGLAAGLVLVAAMRLIPHVGPATLTMAFFLLLNQLTLGEQLAPGVIVPPHPHAPPWLAVFALLAGAVWVDLAGRRLAPWATGAVAGFIIAAIFYPLAAGFIGEAFRYGMRETITAVVAETIGTSVGAVVGASTAWSLLHKAKAAV